jgi:hypothetical protein
VIVVVMAIWGRDGVIMAKTTTTTPRDSLFQLVFGLVYTRCSCCCSPYDYTLRARASGNPAQRSTGRREYVGREIRGGTRVAVVLVGGDGLGRVYWKELPWVDRQQHVAAVGVYNVQCMADLKHVKRHMFQEHNGELLQKLTRTPSKMLASSTCTQSCRVQA